MSGQGLDIRSLGDKHKSLEQIFAGQRLIPGVTTIARLDGRAFHTLLKNAKKPFDDEVVSSMQETARELLDKFNSDLAYCQSDEITLVWKVSTDMFDGKIQKMVSTLASLASVVFNKYYKSEATFDCRVWQVSNLEIAAENIMWREQDAMKNSVSMLASSHFSDVELHGKHTKGRITMLEKKGIYWCEFPHWLKKGSYYQKRDVLTTLSDKELEKIPEKHRPAGPVLRSRILMLEIPPTSTISNLAGVLFNQEKPLPYTTI